jgi:hypothetical protein
VIVVKFKEVKTRSSLAKSSKEGCGSKHTFFAIATDDDDTCSLGSLPVYKQITTFTDSLDEPQPTGT